jgi:hypothetical protein
VGGDEVDGTNVEPSNRVIDVTFRGEGSLVNGSERGCRGHPSELNLPTASLEGVRKCAMPQNRHA